MQAARREHTVAPFQRSLAFSLGIHILICGTALAFAHYGESLFTGGPRVITVALVADGGGRASGRGPAARRAPMAEPFVPALSGTDATQDPLPVETGPEDTVGSGQESPGVSASIGSSPGGYAGIGSGER